MNGFKVFSIEFLSLTKGKVNKNTLQYLKNMI